MNGPWPDRRRGARRGPPRLPSRTGPAEDRDAAMVGENDDGQGVPEEVKSRPDAAMLRETLRQAARVRSPCSATECGQDALDAAGGRSG